MINGQSDVTVVAERERGSQGESCSAIQGEHLAEANADKSLPADSKDKTRYAAHVRHLEKKRKIIAFLRSQQNLIPAWRRIARNAQAAGLVSKTLPISSAIDNLQRTWKKRRYYENPDADKRWFMGGVFLIPK